VADHATLGQGTLAARDAVEDLEPSHHAVIAVHVEQDRRRATMLGDQHGHAIGLQLGDDLGRTALDLGDGLETGRGHSDTLVSHFQRHARQRMMAT